MVSVALLFIVIIPELNGCSGGNSENEPLVVTTLDDNPQPATGTLTLRSALTKVRPGGSIIFAPALDGGEISLSRVDTDNALLKGEVFSMSQGRWIFQGYQERNYGRSALYAAKSVTIDASGLVHGITIRWAGNDTNRARVIAVYGDLTLKNVTITGGSANSEPLSGGSQPYTLARGGGIAVWGVATLVHCTVSGNLVSGEITPNRDRGAFGGGIYANLIVMNDSIVAGNSATGFGAAGGGMYSVGGAELNSLDSRCSSISNSAINGNLVTAQHAYGGGVYTDGGGPGSSRTLFVQNSTIARNKVQDHPGIAESAQFQYYYRGGGIYMSNGSLALTSCTVAENSVTGNPTLFSNRSNMGGGGIAATIGDAHLVESIRLGHSIVVGNTLAGNAEDLFTGSLVHFQSYGNNLVGKLDFSYMLVPIPSYYSLNRRHWPKTGDLSGVPVAAAVDAGTVRRHNSIVSVGTDAGEKAVLYYVPAAAAIDKIPLKSMVEFTYAGYTVVAGRTDDFLNQVLVKIRSLYGGVLGANFGDDLGDLAGIPCYTESPSWPSDPANAQWIAFWRNLDQRIGDAIGSAQLGEQFWMSFGNGPLGTNVVMDIQTSGVIPVNLSSRDQLGISRPSGVLGDIGAIEAYP